MSLSETTYQFVGGSLIIDFLNTVGNRVDPAARRDYFLGRRELREWGVAAGLLPAKPAGGPRRIRKRDLTWARTVREQLYQLFATLAPAVTADQLAPLNQLAVRYKTKQRLAVPANHGTGTKNGPDAVRWIWPPEMGEIDRLLGPVVLDACDLLTSGALDKLKQCSDQQCGWLFLDRSQAGRRRWCSMADCGNRNKARRHYRQLTNSSA